MSSDFNEELHELEANGLRRSLRVKGEEGVLNLSSNDYLGLSRHPKVIESAKKAADEFGAGGVSSRLLAGTLPLHQELESDLSAFLGRERALVYSSGYHVNTGVLPVLAGAEDVIFFDRLCHASIIDGIRLSPARFFSFDHNSPDHLETQLRKRRDKYRRAFIVTEALFSMDGDLGILPEIVYLAEKWKAHVYLDEAHSFGVLGPQGKGLAALQGLLPKVDVWVGTLSKTLGSQGGVVSANEDMIGLLISRSRSFIYTTSLAPPAAGAAREALRLLPEMDKRRESVLAEAARIRSALQKCGFDTGPGVRQIIPVMTGDVQTTKSLSEYLFRSGFFVPSIRPPTVPAGECRVRLSITHEAVNEGLEGLVRVFEKVAAQAEGKPIVASE